MAEQPLGNPAVVGLAGFGMTTLLLQFHNLGWCGSGIVFCTALAFGGGAQLIAGFQEFKTGNSFGLCAFTAFGAFWIALALMFLFLDLQAVPNSFIGAHLKVTGFDIGMFLLGYTIFTIILWLATFPVHTVMILLFGTLVLGFIGLDLVFLAGMKNLLTITAWDLVVCALLAWYLMAHIIFLQLYGKSVLPVGKPWVSKA
jgi:uncharacterized protein